MKVSTKKLKECLEHVAATKEGQIVFAHLRDVCGFNTTILNSKDMQETFHYAARRAVYTHFRQQIPKNHLIKIEHHIEFGEKPPEKTAKKGTKK